MHTPDPWKVEEKRSFHNWRFIPITAQMDPANIINLRTEIATAGQEEDAHLIAAAPELLNALKALVEITEGLRRNPNRTYGAVEAIIEAQKAISKAEGRI